MSRVLIVLLFLLISMQTVKAQEEVVYVPTKLPDLARSYWVLNQLDTNDNKLIDQYLMITECTIYQKYFSSDFEWNKIRNATRDYITTYKNRFSTRFEFVQPIYLDRYDFDTNSFPVLESSKIDLVSRLQIAGNEVGDYPCLSRNFREQDFPPTAALTLAKPFTYKAVKTDQTKADHFLEYLKSKKVDTSKGRPAYIRYRVSIDKSMPPIMNGRQAMANLFGSIDTVAIYGDREKTMLLEEIKF